MSSLEIGISIDSSLILGRRPRFLPCFGVSTSRSSVSIVSIVCISKPSDLLLE